MPRGIWVDCFGGRRKCHMSVTSGAQIFGQENVLANVEAWAESTYVTPSCRRVVLMQDGAPVPIATTCLKDKWGQDNLWAEQNRPGGIRPFGFVRGA